MLRKSRPQYRTFRSMGLKVHDSFDQLVPLIRHSEQYMTVFHASGVASNGYDKVNVVDC